MNPATHSVTSARKSRQNKDFVCAQKRGTIYRYMPGGFATFKSLIRLLRGKKLWAVIVVTRDHREDKQVIGIYDSHQSASDAADVYLERYAEADTPTYRDKYVNEDFRTEVTVFVGALYEYIE